LRGDADPTRTSRPLTQEELTRNTRLVPAAGIICVLAAVLTGAFASPLLLLPALWLAALQLTALRTRWLACTLGVLLLLSAAQILHGGWSALHVVAAACLPAAAAIAARVRTTRARTVEQRMAQLDRILAESDREASPRQEAVVRLGQLENALDTVRGQCAAGRAALWEVQAAEGHARLLAASPPDSVLTELHLTGSPLAWVFEEGQPVTFETGPPVALQRGQAHALRLGRFEQRGFILTVSWPPGVALPAAEQIAAVAAPLAQLLALQDERREVAATRTRVGLLLESLRRIPDALEPEPFAQALLGDAMRITGATGGVIALWRDEAGRILCVAGADGGPAKGATFQPAQSELAMAARAHATILRESRDAQSPLAIAAPGEAWTRMPRTVAAIPLATSSGVLGVLGVWSSAAIRLPQEAITVLETLAPFAAFQLDRAMAYGRVRDTAERDALTGLANRRVFEREIAAESARFDRYGRPVSLVVLDVDHFKSVNDRFGHEAGDAVLRAVATTLRAGVRDADTVTRLGGEEFAVLLPETTLDAAIDLAERLRHRVQQLNEQWSGTQIPVTLSAGVAACPQCVRLPRELVRSADAALYRAKETGRNRVCAAPALQHSAG
jgi:diguanylate cyclase (GGDEF)-like protein